MEISHHWRRQPIPTHLESIMPQDLWTGIYNVKTGEWSESLSQRAEFVAYLQGEVQPSQLKSLDAAILILKQWIAQIGKGSEVKTVMADLSPVTYFPTIGDEAKTLFVNADAEEVRVEVFTRLPISKTDPNLWKPIVKAAGEDAADGIKELFGRLQSQKAIPNCTSRFTPWGLTTIRLFEAGEPKRTSHDLFVNPKTPEHIGKSIHVPLVQATLATLAQEWMATQDFYLSRFQEILDAVAEKPVPDHITRPLLVDHLRHFANQFGFRFAFKTKDGELTMCRPTFVKNKLTSGGIFRCLTHGGSQVIHSNQNFPRLYAIRELVTDVQVKDE
jgi:hypothetical protein